MIKLLVCGTYTCYGTEYDTGFMLDVEVKVFEADCIREATKDAIYDYRRNKLNTESFSNVKITSVTIKPF